MKNYCWLFLSEIYCLYECVFILLVVTIYRWKRVTSTWFRAATTDSPIFKIEKRLNVNCGPTSLAVSLKLFSISSNVAINELHACSEVPQGYLAVNFRAVNHVLCWLCLTLDTHLGAFFRSSIETEVSQISSCIYSLPVYWSVVRRSSVVAHDCFVYSWKFDSTVSIEVEWVLLDVYGLLVKSCPTSILVSSNLMVGPVSDLCSATADLSYCWFLTWLTCSLILALMWRSCYWITAITTHSQHLYGSLRDRRPTNGPTKAQVPV